MIQFQRGIQIACFILFILLTMGAAPLLMVGFPPDLFLRLDPLIVIGTAFSGRVLLAYLAMGGILLTATVFLGRFFCSTICPMGATIDATDKLIRRRRHKISPNTHASDHSLHQSIIKMKYWGLIFILSAAAMGISWVFWVSPIALATRFYALVVNAVLSLGADGFLRVVRPLADRLDWTSLTYAQVEVSRFALLWFPLFCMAVIVAAGFWMPRFWCRCICPAGAILALLSTLPVMRRRVSDACVQCGQCQKECPMAAIGKDPTQTETKECIVCETCVRVCPTEAVHFGVFDNKNPKDLPIVSKSRRGFIWSAVAGLTGSAVAKAGLDAPMKKSGPGHLAPDHLIRPPGSLSEIDFLARCVRCGACMAICPTNTLQPLGMSTGMTAFFSPVVTPRRGPCEPHCNLCGQTCPTQAIRPVSLVEKPWIKIGTAVILKHKCLAWEYGKKCLVCDEVCPYGAIELKMVEGQNVAVPFIDAAKCAGCGYCQYHCPIRNQSAIVVTPMDELRLNSGNYPREARQRGLSLHLKPPTSYPAPQNVTEGGKGEDHSKEEPSPSKLPPGFSD